MTAAATSLEDRISEAGSPVQLLRNPVFYAPFPIPPQYTNWRDEQQAWQETAVLFDQSFHMTDLYLRGKDVNRLLSDLAVNSFATFGKNKAKQLVCCNGAGQFIGDAILFGLDDEEVSVVGRPMVPNWVQYHAETGDYDVEVTRDERILDGDPHRISFRLQVQGPNALKIVEKAVGKPVNRIPFFNIGTFQIAGVPVRALNHTMTGVPGQEFTGLEMTGPFEQAGKVHDALVAAGAEFGLREGGAISYGSTPLAVGWIPTPLPAIYDRPQERPYRQWLAGGCAEARLTLGGSFDSDDITDYYTTPWDVGLGRVIKFDHDFVGREALERLAQQPQRRKVWLRWNADDVTRAMASNLFDEPGKRTARLDPPVGVFSATHRDKVLRDGELVGLSTIAGYTVPVRGWFSLATVDPGITDGSEVSVVWGEADGGASKPWVESHAQTEIRATVSDSSPV